MEDKWNEFVSYNNNFTNYAESMVVSLEMITNTYIKLQKGFDEQLQHTSDSHRDRLYHDLIWTLPLTTLRKEMSTFISSADDAHANIMRSINGMNMTSSSLFDMFDELIDENNQERLEEARDYFLKSRSTLKVCKQRESGWAKSLRDVKLQAEPLDKIHTSPEILKLKQSHIQMLRDVFNTQPQQIQSKITKVISKSLEQIHRVLGVYRLRHILSNTLSDVTIISCLNPREHVLWKIDTGNLPMQLVKNKNHSQTMGPTMNQLDHVTCGPIVAAEIVSAVRHIDGRDNPIVPYSPQDIVDFAVPSLRAVSRQGHYCYEIKLRDALSYIKRDGIQRLDARPLATVCKIDVSPRQTLGLGYISDFKELKSFEEMLRVLVDHPVAATIPVFEPEYLNISNKIYRGPSSRISRYKTMHAINVTGGDVENGENFFWARSSIGEEFGVEGRMKISADMMMFGLNFQKDERFMEYPFKLLNNFIYPILLSLRDEDERRNREESI